MTLRSLVFVALSALLLAGPGCAIRRANRIDVVPEGTASIVINNERLQSRVAIRDGRALYEDDILLAVIELENLVRNKMTLEYRFSWKDSDGINLEADSWSELHVASMEQKQVQGRATEPGAVWGRFELRPWSGRTNADN